jgi:hypothetical protein
MQWPHADQGRGFPSTSRSPKTGARASRLPITRRASPVCERIVKATAARTPDPLGRDTGPQ